MKKLLGILFTMVLLVSVLTACGKGSKDESSSDAGSGTVDSSSESGQSEKKLLTGKHHVEIKIEKYGTIKLELDADTAPISETNFVKLA